MMPEGYRTLCGACAPPAVEVLSVAVVEGRCHNCGVKGKSPELACYANVLVPQQAWSSAPLMGLLRILELCWRERQGLSSELVERLREQLEGPLGVKAKADERVLDAMKAIPLWALRKTLELDDPGNYSLPAVRAELVRRRLEAMNDRDLRCLFKRMQAELGTAVELAAAVQRCGARDLPKRGIDEECPWCVEAVRAVALRVTPTQREIVERWMHLPGRAEDAKD